MQVLHETQTVQPFQSIPAHWPYFAAVHVEADAAELVVVVVDDALVVVAVVELSRLVLVLEPTDDDGGSCNKNHN